MRAMRLRKIHALSPNSSYIGHLLFKRRFHRKNKGKHSHIRINNGAQMFCFYFIYFLICVYIILCLYYFVYILFN